jgi:TOBE domain
MVERTVYVGASLQVIVRLPIGEAIQVSIANTGGADAYLQGTPVCVRVPPDALRVLSDTAPRPPVAEREQAEPPAVAAGLGS